jgi:hypothetical protein
VCRLAQKVWGYPGNLLSFSHHSLKAQSSPRLAKKRASRTNPSNSRQKDSKVRLASALVLGILFNSRGELNLSPPGD